MLGGRFRPLAGVLVVIVALGVLACGGKSHSSSGSGKVGGATGGDLRMVGSDPITLDPARASDANSAKYIVEIFSGLVSLDKDLKVIPDLAESWDLSSDGKVYTFHLRKNATFQDGKPVTADDFKYSLERTAKLGRTTSTTAAAYLGDINGVAEVISGKTDSISGVQIVDASTLKITIDASKPYFLAKLTFPTAFVVQKAQVEADPQNWTRKPIGTGPFKLASYDVNQRLILEAFADYALGAPHLKRVLYNLSGGSSLTQYENGDIDISGLGLDDLERAQDKRDPLNKELVSEPSLDVSYIGFNTKKPPFDDANVRRAFAMAIDKNQITKVVLKNALPPATSIMMPGLPGFNEKAKAPAFDPAAAKAALAQSRYKDVAGLGKVSLTEIGGGATAGPDTQVIVQMLKQNLGVDVSIEEEEEASFFDDVDQGKLQMWTIGWVMDYPDPEDIIDLLFLTNSRQNNTGYSNPQVDSLIRQARVEPDVTKRLDLYQQAEQIILNDTPWVPLYFGRRNYVVKPYVKNFQPGAIEIPYLRNVSIEK